MSFSKPVSKTDPSSRDPVRISLTKIAKADYGLRTRKQFHYRYFRHYCSLLPVMKTWGTLWFRSSGWLSWPLEWAQISAPCSILIMYKASLWIARTQDRGTSMSGNCNASRNEGYVKRYLQVLKDIKNCGTSGFTYRNCIAKLCTILNTAMHPFKMLD